MATEILRCSIDRFLNHYVPFIPSAESISDAFQAFKSFSTDQRLAGQKIDHNSRMACNRQHVGVQTDAIPDETDGAMFLLNAIECLRTVGCYEEENGVGKPRTCRFFDRPSTMVD